MDTSIYLSQAYRDAYDDYERSISQEDFCTWDYVIITASNEKQAEGYRMQLKLRKDRLPAKTHFAVIPDEGGVRVGSGGATLSVLRYITACEGSCRFDRLRILVIHSGGDSKRVPQYSALGKLFSPVPHQLRNGDSSTLFDEFMISMSSVPSRIRNGMLLLSGDVLLLFNPLLIDFSGRGAAVLSFKENVQTGKDHGVYLRGDNGNVERFLHKQSVEKLTSLGAVNEREQVDIDTGAVLFSSEVMDALYSLIDTDEKYFSLVNNRVCLSLYGDFQYPMAEHSTLEDFYNEKPEAELTPELHEARTLVWNVLRPYRMKLIRLAPARFIHFGTSPEILNLLCCGIDEYACLDWQYKVNSSIVCDIAGYNGVVSNGAKIGKNCFVEVSYIHHRATVGSNVILSHIDILNETIPSDVVLHGLKRMDGKFVCRIYGLYDNPKKDLIFGTPITEISRRLGIDENALWAEGEKHLLWTAAIYPAMDTIRDAVGAALNVYQLAHGAGDVEAWLSAEHTSLKSGFNDADTSAILQWNEHMLQLVQMDRIRNAIQRKQPAEELRGMLATEKLSNEQKSWMERQLRESDFSTVMRLYYYFGCALNNLAGETQIKLALNEICHRMVDALIVNRKERNIQITARKDTHTVRLPLRVNWGGGWSDTPPYCNEHGGTVLNCAILLNGSMPVEVTIERNDRNAIIFDSADLDVCGEFSDIADLQNYGDPYDPFAIPKAALLITGIVPWTGSSVQEILDNLGGGFTIHTYVHNVPKGSGLGTSSILAAAMVRCILEYFGIGYTNNDIYSTVLSIEQVMSTGGGWQDQVGGLTNGIKFCTTFPGLTQDVTVTQVTPPPFAMQELKDRFALIYTGQRRLARNILRNVVGNYLGNDKPTVDALHEIQRIAALMRFELEKGNIDEFAELLNRHWVLSRQIDTGSTNTLINQIFDSIDDLIDGRMICGAGGGGFLQVVLKKGVTSEALHERLKSVFADSEIDVWPCELI